MSRRKKQGEELAYVKRNRNHWAVRRREETKREKGVATEVRSTRRRDDARPFLDPSKPAARACRSIPLDKSKIASGPPPDPQQEEATTALPLSVAAQPSETPKSAVQRAEEPRAVVVADTSALRPHLEQLDSVVHDFVAALDPGALAASTNVAGSSNASRLMRLLEEDAPSTKSRVLGPPVLLGASPPIALESLLGFLSSMHMTGILRVQADDVTFMVSVVNGDVVHAVSQPRPEPELLGNILVARGIIDPIRLARFFEECGASASKIGEALNRQALVSTDELRKALEQQMQQLFDRLFDSECAEWCFYAGEATLAYIDMRMNVIRVLLESARKQDEGRNS